MLEEWNLDYDLAENGLEALKLVQQHKYRIILMDIRMPTMDGYEATRSIRAMEGNVNQNIPIVALTASALVDEKERAISAGMDYHVAKPFSPADLELVLNKFHILSEVKGGNSSVFIFSESLDQAYLQEFYQDDLSRAELMFDVFLKVIDAEFQRLEELMIGEDWKAFSSQAHKIKPNFQMVGLPELSRRMKNYEAAKDDVDLRKMITLEFQEVKREFFDAKVLVAEELERLKQFKNL